jgi:hypothetical protein
MTKTDTSMQQSSKLEEQQDMHNSSEHETIVVETDMNR